MNILPLEIINTVKLILGLEDNEKDNLLLSIINIQTNALLTKINEPLLPPQLEFIVIETSIVRFNRLGSEGLKSENIDVISQTFIEDVFEPYLSYISNYKSSLKSPSKLRMM